MFGLGVHAHICIYIYIYIFAHPILDILPVIFFHTRSVRYPY